MIDMYLYDDNESSQVQFVGFVGEFSRYDLMLVQTDRHFGKCNKINFFICASLTNLVKQSF